MIRWMVLPVAVGVLAAPATAQASPMTTQAVKVATCTGTPPSSMSSRGTLPSTPIRPAVSAIGSGVLNMLAQP